LLIEHVATEKLDVAEAFTRRRWRSGRDYERTWEKRA
jgi:hypothetical protein